MIGQLRDDLNSIKQSLDAAEAASRASDRDAKLHVALIASHRAITQFLEDEELFQMIARARTQAEEHREDIAATTGDVAVFTAFLNTEARLLHDFGLDDAVAQRLIDQVWDSARTIGDIDYETVVPGLRKLQAELAAELEQVARQEAARKRWLLVNRALSGLGGGLLVATNAVVGAAGAPMTGGLTIAGAALSGAVGSYLMGRAGTSDG